MAYISEHQVEFDGRLRRIAERTATRTQTIFVGEDEVYDIRLRVRNLAPRGMRARLGQLTGFLVALALGAAAHGLGMILRYHLQATGYLKDLDKWTGNPDLEMLVQVTVGFVLALLAGFAIGQRARKHLLTYLMGSVLGVMFFHNAVHQWPEVFSTMTSAFWVAKLCATTKASSLLWRGISIAL